MNSQTKIIVNKYQGKCAICGKRVPPSEGLAYLDDGWKVAHLDCKPEYAKVIKGKEIAAEKSAEDAKAEWLALGEKLGIIKEPLNTQYRQLAWSDETTWSYAYTGEGTLEEFRKYLTTKPQSSWGALRWSQGVGVMEVDPVCKLVHLKESVGIAD